MIRLIRAELLKLRTTQVWFWLLLGAIAISALFVIGPLASDDIKSSGDVADMFSNAAIAYVLTFVLGVLGVTTEFRYQTITPTLLATPSRWALVTAKMITYAILGIVYAAICVLVELAIAVPWLSSKGVDYSLGGDGIPHALISVFVVLALFGTIGLGVGALLKNQIVAVTVGIVFLVVLQNIFLAIPGVKHVYPYLPGGAAAAIAAVTSDNRSINGVTLLSTAGGVIVLVLWAIIPAVVGASFTLNRDIT
ncbi:ABC transporter permease [uncultured Jatrophihabitans sp.]|uniref:ABC transporter permease n=1 Tax=uncultured Jatrophihabitans sp. TaxID=1610747 RepID=UPI0035CB0399